MNDSSVGEIVRVVARRVCDGPEDFMLIKTISEPYVYGQHFDGRKANAHRVTCTYPSARELEDIRALASGHTRNEWLAACDATVEALHKKMFQPAPGETGKKFDSEKTQYHLMPLHALEQVNLVLMHGAKKYGEDNWQQVDGWQHRYYNAALRHIFAHRKGEKNDPESNISHLAHAICSLMFLIEKECHDEK